MFLRASPWLCPVLVHWLSQIFSPCPHTPAWPPWATHMLTHSCLQPGAGRPVSSPPSFRCWAQGPRECVGKWAAALGMATSPRGSTTQMPPLLQARLTSEAP